MAVSNRLAVCRTLTEETSTLQMKITMRRRWRWYTFSLGILAASGIIVQAIRPDAQSILHNPLSIIFLMGALPWFLQCASVAVMFYCVFDAGKHRGSIVLPGLVVAASVGAVWWSGVMMACGHSDLASLLVKALSYDMRRQHAIESPAELFLFEVVGPLTCPAQLEGPVLLVGWSFVWCLLSTISVIALLTCVGHMATQTVVQKGTAIRVALSLIAGLIYVAPVIVRLIVRIAHHASR